MFLLLTAALTAAVGRAVAGSAATADPTDANNFDWGSIEPTPDLRYHDCYDGFRCARLKVPLDWNNPSDGRSVALAITTKPAKVPIDHPDFGGTIFTNPGGPGGSGVSFIRSFASILQGVVDGNKKYEFLSWDPRGVQFTTASADCFNDTLARDAWMLERRGLGWPGTSEDGLRRHLGLFKARGTLCEKTLGESEILKHVTTAAVCRDMVEMADRNDELRRKQLAEMRRARAGEGQHPIIAAEEPKSGDVVRVQYIGFSYGTVVGNTFASMYPGRVGRVLIDGVVDIADYMQGLWSRNLLDTDAIIDYFYDACFAEGPGCPIRAATDSSGADIKQRIENLIAEAEETPVPFLHGNILRAVSGDDIRANFRSAIYQPLEGFPQLARDLAEILKGNYAPLFDKNPAIPVLQDACSVNSTAPPTTPDATGAIACSDAYDSQLHGFDYYTDAVKFLRNQSRTFGPWWSEIRLQCVGMRSPPAWRFTGPWTTPPADPSLKEGIPAAPMLIFTNRLDPVTPLVNANLMSAGHPGSAVVTVEAAGHCAVGSGWNECTNQIVRDFFEYGTVPKNGTVCESKCKPWHAEECGPLAAAGGVKAHSGRDRFRWFDGSLPLAI